MLSYSCVDPPRLSSCAWCGDTADQAGASCGPGLYERSIARLAEDVAAGPPYPPELIETMEDFDELRALAGEDEGPLDVEEAFAALGITADLPSESDDSDSDDTDERPLRIITS